MSRAFAFVLAALVVSYLLAGCAAPQKQGFDLRDAWMRPASRGANGAVYFTVQNHSSVDDEITGVSAEVAEAVEVHESVMNGDVMQMHPLESVPIASGQEVTFEPGGLHIMLVGLQQDLRAGDEIEITLHFKNYADVKVTVPVQDSPGSEEEHPGNDH